MACVGGPVISAEKEAALPRASLSSSASSLRVCCFNCLINRVNFSTFSALRPNFYAANVEKYTMVRVQVGTARRVVEGGRVEGTERMNDVRWVELLYIPRNSSNRVAPLPCMVV